MASRVSSFLPNLGNDFFSSSKENLVAKFFDPCCVIKTLEAFVRIDSKSLLEVLENREEFSELLLGMGR